VVKGGSGDSTVSFSMNCENTMIVPCKSKPNCVSSLNQEERFHVEPLRYDNLESAKNKLLRILKTFKRVRIIATNECYIHAEFTSLIFRFVDDVEFYFDAKESLIHLKSASRIGYSDFGMNRKRIEAIRRKFLEGG
jgi:uncharacterized protein (DUF1499 family)